MFIFLFENNLRYIYLNALFYRKEKIPLSGNHLPRLTALTWKAGNRQWPCAQLCVCTRAVGGFGEVCYECDTGPGNCLLCSFQRFHQWLWGGSPPVPRHQAAEARWWQAGPGSIRSTSEQSSPHSRWRRGALNESERVKWREQQRVGGWWVGEMSGTFAYENSVIATDYIWNGKLAYIWWIYDEWR